jgi:hypothetical protein
MPFLDFFLPNLKKKKFSSKLIKTTFEYILMILRRKKKNLNFFLKGSPTLIIIQDLNFIYFFPNITLKRLK